MKREARTSLNRYLTCHNLNRFFDFFLFRHCRVKESRLCNFLQNSLLHRRKALFLPPIDFFIVLARVAGIEPACLPMGESGRGQLPCCTRISEPTGVREQRGGPVLVKQTFHLWLGWIGQGISSLMRRARPNRFPHRHAGVAWQKGSVVFAPAYTGETPPYGTLCPCRCVKLWTNAPASMNTCCKAARTGLWPQLSASPCVVSGFSPAPYKMPPR